MPNSEIVIDVESTAAPPDKPLEEPPVGIADQNPTALYCAVADSSSRNGFGMTMDSEDDNCENVISLNDLNEEEDALKEGELGEPMAKRNTPYFVIAFIIGICELKSIINLSVFCSKHLFYLQGSVTWSESQHIPKVVSLTWEMMKSVCIFLDSGSTR
jgi:hypothetical protein